MLILRERNQITITPDTIITADTIITDELLAGWGFWVNVEEYERHQMSDTPRSNKADSKWENSESAVDAFNVAIDLCRELERELSSANTQIGLLVSGSKQQERQIKFLKEKIQRLVEAGNKLGPYSDGHCECNDGSIVACEHCIRYSQEWTKAKEGL